MLKPLREIKIKFSDILKMNFAGFLIVIYASLAKAEELNFAFNIVTPTLEYYRSRSAVLVVDGNGKQWDTLDILNFINLQKFLSSNNLFFTSLTSFSTLSQTLKENSQRLKETVLILEFDKKLSQILQKTMNETNMILHKWLVTTSTSNFEELTIPLGAEFIVARKSAAEGYALSEIYDTELGKKLTKALGYWINGKSFYLNASTDLFKRRQNLEGTLIKVVSPRKDNCIATSFETGVANIVWCIHQKVWSVMAEMLNATTEIKVVSNLTSETIQNTDAELTFRSAPLNVVDLNTRSYVWPIFRVKVEVVTSHIKQQVEWQTYVLPFSSEMWMAILIWIILCDFLLAYVEFIVQRKEKRHSFLRQFNEVSFTTTFTFCSQGVLGPSKSLSSHTIFLMMFIVPSVVFPGYSAILTSYLTVQLHKKPFRSLEELSRLKDYKLGWHNTFALEHMFNLEDTSPVNQALLKNNVLTQRELPATDVEGIERMCNEKFAFLTIMDTILALKPKCTYFKLKQHFKVVFTSMEMKKSSWYKYWLDRCERTLDYTGNLYRIAMQVVMKNIKYENLVIDTGEVPPIRMENIVLPFAVLLLGVASSVLLLVLEVACFKLRNVSERQSLQ